MALWTLEHRRIKGQPVHFDGHWYLKSIYFDTHPKIYVKKSAQIGISEWMVTSAIFYTQKGYNAIYVFPNSGLMGDFCRGRIDPIFEETPYLASLVQQGTDNIGIKKIGKGFLYLRGAGSDEKVRRRKMKSIDADIMYYDELDEMSEDVTVKGRARLGHSQLQWERGVSTPTFPGKGIDKIYEESNQFEWFIKCNHCGEQQTLKWPDNIDFKNEVVICNKCRKELDRCIEGEWVAKYPNREIHGYFANKLFCIRSSIPKLIQQSKAELELDIQEFYNSDLGLAYEPKGQSLLESDILKCKGEHSNCEKNLGCTMGVDVGKHLNIRISKITGEKRKCVYLGTLKNFEELDQLMTTYDIDVCVIDANPETRKAKEFQERFYGRVYLAYYMPSDIYRSELYIEDQIETEDSKIDVIKINRTQAADNVYNSFISRKNILPRDFMNVKNYIEQMVAPKRIPKKGRDGNPYYAWEEFGKPDHYFHADIYDFLATEINKKFTIGILDDDINKKNDKINISERIYSKDDENYEEEESLERETNNMIW